MSSITEFKPSARSQLPAYLRALSRVGAMINREIRTPLDEVELLQQGINPVAVDKLATTIPSMSDLNWVIARRTLTHRKKKGERLTAEESGRWLRAAKICTHAEEVFGNTDKAAAWLRKPRKVFNQQSALVIMQTEPGAELVNIALNQLDAGYFA
ncbi:MAG: DUF2384 domain-containing protein [Pseudomonadales bacterium]|nr:DUF2384 domain-containing protein [Pseudomonadales bacterium]